MTDRGKFELLAMSILRGADSDCSSVIHTGINAQGETIPSPIDGFCLVPGSKPDRFLFLQFTTTDRTNLRNKWLKDDEGDLIKAYNLAQEIKAKNPEADFTIILVTNQRIDMADKLAIDTLQKAKELRLNCRIWEQSRLVYFLDNKPEGHWLRRQYLGVEAELLSESLLSYICKESLARYEKEIQLSDPKSWLPRTIDGFIRAGILENKYTFQVLVGDSGFGKSVAAYKALKEHIESDGYGLWVPAEFIHNCTSIENVVDKTLRELHPHLEKDPDKYIRQYILEGSKLILVIDDINRIDEHNKIINRLLNWSRPIQSDAVNDTRNSPQMYFIICPLWTQVWNLDQRRISWVHSVSIGLLTPEEGLIAIRLATSAAGVSLTSAEDRVLGTKLGNDPVLIGLFYQLINGSNSISLNDLNEIADGVVERFINQCIQEVASNKESLYLENEYMKALSEVCALMLRKRRLNPSWEEIQVWFEKDREKLKILRELIRHKKLIRLTDRENRLIFRHDRIRETLLVKMMISILKAPLLNREILREPYYAEIIGKSIILVPQNESTIRDFAEYHPLVLFEALKNFGNPTLDYHRKVIDIINEWVEKNLTTGGFLDSIVNSICWSLIDTDSIAVLEITEKLPHYWPILLSRLRNGCAKSGAEYCNRISIDTGDDLRDQIIDHAKKRHKEQLVDELKELLTSVSSTDTERKGSLALAGFLEFAELENEISHCWNLASDKEYVLAEAIWAGSRCCTKRPDRLLGPMMNYLASLPDKGKSKYEPGPRNQVSEELAFAISRGISNEAINYFISVHNTDEALRWPIAIMLERIDAPEAIEYMVRFAAKEKGTFFAMDLSDTWNPELPARRRLSPPSMDRLKMLWSLHSTNKQVKYHAFRIWINSAQKEQLDILREIPSESSLSRMAIRKRAQLGDMSVVRQLASFLLTDIHMLNVVHNIWCCEIMAVTEHYMETLKMEIPDESTNYSNDTTYYISRLLTTIPSKDAEILLDKYWKHIKCIPRFVQAALYVGTEKTLKLADSSIHECPGSVPIFKKLDWLFGFFEQGRQQYLTAQHLERLAPYLSRLDDDMLWHIAEFCQRIGIPEWNKEYISKNITEKWRMLFYPADEDLLQELDKFSADSRLDLEDLMWHFTHWVEKFDKRHDPRAQAIIERWLGLNGNSRGLLVVAAFLKIKGTRQDLSLLDRYQIEGPEEEILKIKADVKFSICRHSLE